MKRTIMILAGVSLVSLSLGLNAGNSGPTSEIEESRVPEHHHHKRGSNCEHGVWATDDVLGHHHHKNDVNCSDCTWSTSNETVGSVGAHHHHKRGSNCEHGVWATSDVRGGSPGRCVPPQKQYDPGGNK